MKGGARTATSLLPAASGALDGTDAGESLPRDRQPQAGGQPGPEQRTIRRESSCDVAARRRIAHVSRARSSPRAQDSSAQAVDSGLVVFSAGRSRWRRGSSSAARVGGTLRIPSREASTCSVGDSRSSARSRSHDADPAIADVSPLRSSRTRNDGLGPFLLRCGPSHRRESLEPLIGSQAQRKRTIIGR